MKRIAILIEDHYQVLEAWYPYIYLKGESFETVFVGSGRSKAYHSKEGYVAEEEISIDKASPDDFDAVVIPGGYAPDMMRRHRAMIDFVKAMDAQGKVVAAICHGLWIPVSAGILRGRKATSFFSIKDDVTNAGATWVDRNVVVDRNFISSRNPFDLPAFCREIVKALGSGAAAGSERGQQAEAVKVRSR
jgi:protease I